ncbi:MAG: helix-turn-helix transcriptional regulator [Patescibacteria group bacterium]|jgi:ribosome-binding protein aMBF1 (putative translation factor)
MNKTKSISFSFEGYRQEQLKNNDFKKHYDYYGKQLKVAYQILQLRKNKKMSQLQLAQKIGTTQSNLARIESGRQNLTTGTLEKIAKAFGRELKIEFC